MNERPERPEFATTMRGYDKLQVDDYINRLQDIVADAEERSRAAESELEFSRHATIGPRVSKIFDLAVAEAKEMRERVQGDADRMRADARSEAEAIITSARENAEQVRGEADRAREETVADAQSIRGEVLDEVQRLRESKSTLLGDLGRLQEVLAQATGSEPARRAAHDSESGPGHDAPTEPFNGDDEAWRPADGAARRSSARMAERQAKS
jgi:DivIVA domain-containing protein